MAEGATDDGVGAAASRLAASAAILAVSADASALVDPSSLRVVAANEAFRSSFGMAERVLQDELSPEILERLRSVVQTSTPAAPFDATLATTGVTCSIRVHRSADDYLAVSFRPAAASASFTALAPAPSDTRVAPAAPTIEHTKLWDNTWLGSTNLNLRSNISAISSLCQLLSSTPLSAEQSLYVQNLRCVRTRTRTRVGGRA